MAEGGGTDPNVKLGVIEEQVRGMRHDFGKLEQEVKSMFGQVLNHMSSMQKDYVLKSEAVRDAELQKERDDAIKLELKEVKEDMKKLHGRPTWSASLILTAAVAVIAVLGTVIAAYIQKGH